MVAVPGDTVRGGARMGPGAEAGHSGRGPRGIVTPLSGVRTNAGGGKLGWDDRRDTGRGAGDWGSIVAAGVLPRDRLFRPWIRHWTWRRSAGGRSGRR